MDDLRHIIGAIPYRVLRTLIKSITVKIDPKSETVTIIKRDRTHTVTFEQIEKGINELV